MGRLDMTTSADVDKASHCCEDYRKAREANETRESAPDISQLNNFPIICSGFSLHLRVDLATVTSHESSQSCCSKSSSAIGSILTVASFFLFKELPKGITFQCWSSNHEKACFHPDTACRVK
jgi:hypothetical protein